MNTTFSVHQLASLRLPGLPRSVRRLRAKANTEQWRSVTLEREGRPTEKAYPLDSLPPAAQQSLARKLQDNEIPFTDDAAPESPFERAARERMALVEAAHRQIGLGLSASEAYAKVSESIDRKHSARSIRRWDSAVRGLPKTDWLDALLPRGGEAAHYAPCHPKAWEFIVSDYLRASRPPWATCYQTLLATAARHGWSPIPHRRTLWRRLKAEVSPLTIKLAREGEKALATAIPPVERDHSVFAAGEAVNSDGHRFDVKVLWLDGVVERPILVGFQDIYSGKILSWRIDRTENAELIRFAFGDLCTNWGIPSFCYFDNGRAFSAAEITGQSKHPFRFPENTDSDVCGVITSLGVSVHWTKPYSGRSKPIERAWRDLCNSIAKHARCDGAYTGNSPVNKPHNYDTATVSLDKFIDLVRVQIDAHNARGERRSKVCHGRSFDVAFTESYQLRTVRKPTEDQGRMLYLSMAVVKTQRLDGAIWYLENRFHADALAERCSETVIIRFEANDLSKGVYVYTPDNKLICHAERLGAEGYDSRSAARDAARRVSRVKRAERELLESTATMDPRELDELHLGGGTKKKTSPAATQLVPLSTLQKSPVVAPTTKDRDRESQQEELLASISHLRDGLPRRRAASE